MDDSRPRFIYGVLDEYGDIRYIGQSFNPKRRVYQLWYMATHNRGNIQLKQWLGQLKDPPLYVLLQESEENFINEVEAEWIVRFPPGQLLNSVMGGGWRPESAAKMSAAQKGHPGYFKGKKSSAETRARISRSGLGRKHSEETKAKISAAHKGRKHPPEVRARMSAAAKNRVPRKKET